MTTVSDFDATDPEMVPALTTASRDLSRDLSRDQRYRSVERLRKRPEYLRVQQRGERFTTSSMVVLALPSAVGRTRFGITVSKKVGDAPTRNRVKRKFREIYRLNKSAWPADVDFVVIARRASIRATPTQLCADLRRWSQRYSRRAAQAKQRAVGASR